MKKKMRNRIRMAVGVVLCSAFLAGSIPASVWAEEDAAAAVLAECPREEVAQADASADEAAPVTNSVEETSDVPGEAAADDDTDAAEAVATEAAAVDETAGSAEVNAAEETSDAAEKEVPADAAGSDVQNENDEEQAGSDAVEEEQTQTGVADTLVASDGKFSVTVSYGDDAGLPEGTTLVVKALGEGSAAYAQAEAAAEAAYDDAEVGVAALDISLHDAEGREIEPLSGAQVQVNISASVLPEDADPETVKVLHLPDHAADAETVATAAAGSVSADDTTAVADFSVDSFSTFTITWAIVSDGAIRADLTVHYVDQNGTEIDGPRTEDVSVTGNNSSVTLSRLAGSITGYTYEKAYVKDQNGQNRAVTSIRFARTGTYGNPAYRVSFYRSAGQRDELVTEETQSGERITKDVYLEYEKNHKDNDEYATVYYLLTPTSNADSNYESQWNAHYIAAGTRNAVVNRTDATYSNDKNIIINQGKNGDLSKYIKQWPDGTTGKTWTITAENSSNMWPDISANIAKNYQEQLKKELGINETISASDITSITLTPYKISINNGNESTTHGTTKTTHIDCTISVVCSKAYHYAFHVDYPEGSKPDGVVKEGDKQITTVSPEEIRASDQPSADQVPSQITVDGIRYEFQGWHTDAAYQNKAGDFPYQPTKEEINAKGGTIHFYAYYQQATRNIRVSKVWDDTDNHDHKRPDAVTVRLYKDDRDTGKTITLDAGNGWQGTFTGNSLDGAYEVKEDPVAGYVLSSVRGSAENGFVITNTHELERVRVSVQKVWNDEENAGGIRPTDIQVQLLADNVPVGDPVTISKDDDWAHTFSNLMKYKADGQEIDYTVSEESVPEYSTSYADDPVDHQITITNTYTPGRTSVSVRKVWNDADDQDGKRPAAVTVNLLANGTVTDTAELTSANDWSHTFTNLLEKKNGQDISYTIAEASVAEGYTGAVAGNAADGYTIINTHAPETVTISGTKHWEGDTAEERPSSITVRLLADNVEVADQTVTPVNGEWKYSFHGFPRYAGKSGVITYTVKEDAITDYTSRPEGYDLVNTYTPGKTSITVSKVWEDQDNQDGVRPAAVTVHLLADGEDTGKTVKLEEKNNWSAQFEDLNVNKAGVPISYTVREEAVVGYVTDISGNPEIGYTIINTHTPETVDIEGTKTWEGDEDNLSARPQEVTIRLYANGEEKASASVKPDADGNWKYSFADLPKYENGSPINYKITEDQVEDYTAIIDGYHVTNKYTPNKTDVMVIKAWNDENDKDGIRPDKVTIKLLADGKDTGNTVTLDKDNHWAGEFLNLPERDSDGREIVYTVEEVKVDGYIIDITGSAKTGYTITNTHVVKPDKDPEEKPADHNDPTDENGGADPASPAAPVKNDAAPASNDNKPVSKPDSTHAVNVKTGDTTDFLPYLAVMLGAAVVLIGLIRSSKKLGGQNKD